MQKAIRGLSGRHKIRIAALTVLACLLVGPGAAGMDGPVRAVEDDTGRQVQVPLRIERIVSLAPSVTETLYALNLQDRLVGVSNQCDYPPEVARLPRVGNTIKPSLESIVDLQPDLVLASTSANREETVEALDRLGTPVYVTDVHSVEEILASIGGIAEVTGAATQGKTLLANLRARLQTVNTRTASLPPRRVLVAVWLQPVITTGSGTFLNDAVMRAGGISIAGDLAEEWPRFSLEAVVDREPEFLVMARTHGVRKLFETIKTEPAWQELRPLREGKVIWVDDSLLRPGPRIVDAIEQLARAIHPAQTGGSL